LAFNGDSNCATAIDAATGKVAGTIDLGGGPEFAAADGNGFVYNNLEDQDQVVTIDSRTLTVVQRWPTAPCASPSIMVMDRANRRLLIGCRSKVMAVMNAITGRSITTLPIGDLVDATVFDSGTQLIFNSNREGTISVIHEDRQDAAPSQNRSSRSKNASALPFDNRIRTVRSASCGEITDQKNSQGQVIARGVSSWTLNPVRVA
jgi:hypothetical protein